MDPRHDLAPEALPTAKLEQFLREPRLTPYVVVDVDVVEARYCQLAAALPSTRIHYAVKANPGRPVLERLVALGAAFDVASPGEIEQCLAAGAVAADLSYGNTVKKARDIAAAHALGVAMFTVDCHGELDKVLEHAPGAAVCVRLFHEGEGADWPLSRKFGTGSSDVVDLLVRVLDSGAPAGVSFHVGSQQRDVEAWDAVLEATAQCFERATALVGRTGVRPTFVNLGGGFPARYVDGIPAVETYGRAIMAAFDRHFGTAQDRPVLLAEPGRYLVGDAGVLRTEVVLVSERSIDPKRWVYLDCGRFGGLAETMEEAIRYRLRTPHDGAPTGPVAIAGPTCDSADVLYEKSDYRLPLALRAGDPVDILSAGAYTTTYSAVGFNGFAPLAEHFV